jgi:hypothetical protein
MKTYKTNPFVFASLLFLFVLSIASCGGSDSTKTDTNSNVTGSVTHPYFKTTVGSTSAYSDNSTSTVTANSNNRITVNSVENGTTTQRTYLFTGNTVAVESSRDYDASGKLIGTTTFTPALKIFPASTTTGATETQTVAVVTPTGNGSTTCKLTVLGPDTVTTTVATYQNALKIQSNCNNGAVNSYDWFASGVGQIKSVDINSGAVVELASPSSPTNTTPPAAGSKIPAELVGIWGNSSQTYTFYADDTFAFVSLYWPGGGLSCINTSRMETSSKGNVAISGSNMTINTTGGQLKTWGCFAPSDGSPSNVSQTNPFTTIKSWSITGNQLTLSDGTTSGTFTYTKQ